MGLDGVFISLAVTLPHIQCLIQFTFVILQLTGLKSQGRCWKDWVLFWGLVGYNMLL
jgi:predicted cobalt transporter CbtA